VTDACVASCEPNGYAAAALQVWNDGKRGVTGALVRTYGTTTSGLALLDERRVDVEAQASVEFELTGTWEAFGAELYIVVDELLEVEECNEDDNHGTWTELPGCPR
jgi:hypothetical protein